MAAPGKTAKKRSTRPASLTERNKRNQAKARERRALKRLGRAAQKRQAKREWLRGKRKEDPSFGQVSQPEWHCRHEAKDGQERKGGIIYSCVGWFIK